MFHVKHPVQTPFEDENSFVVDLLTTLRREKFSPPAWRRFLVRSWEMSWQTAQAHPTLTLSWRRVTMLIFALTVLILIANLHFEGLANTMRLLPGFVFCVAWQLSDLFWHLGLNRQMRISPLKEQETMVLPTLGLANTLTWLRGLAACYLIGRLVGGLATSNSLTLLVFLFGIATDILDGQVARSRHTSSKLGQIADGETDFCLYTSITFILIQNGVLSLWPGFIMLLRFFIPLLAALGSYFLLAHPVRFGPTLWGKFAGLAQCLYLLLLLAPPRLTSITHPVHLPLLVITLALLVIAPIAQIAANVRTENR